MSIAFQLSFVNLLSQVFFRALKKDSILAYASSKTGHYGVFPGYSSKIVAKTSMPKMVEFILVSETFKKA